MVIKVAVVGRLSLLMTASPIPILRKPMRPFVGNKKD